MKALGWKLTLLLLVAAVIALGLLIYGDSSAANIAFFIIGALVAVVTQVAVELQKRHELERDLARSLYVELANRVARCVFDFEKPFEKLTDKETIFEEEMDLLRLRKFAPVPPVIYPAAARHISVLEGNAPAAVILFYTHFAIYRSDMDAIVREAELHDLSHVPPENVAMVASRLDRTLGPGLEALRELSKHVPDHTLIDAASIRYLDKLVPGHERAHLTLRQRLAHYAEKVHPN